jgi:hypothetical protein
MVVFLSSSLLLPPLYTWRVEKESGDEGNDSGKERDDCRDEEKLMTNLSKILIGEKTALR